MSDSSVIPIINIKVLNVKEGTNKISLFFNGAENRYYIEVSGTQLGVKTVPHSKLHDMDWLDHLQFSNHYHMSSEGAATSLKTSYM